MQHDAWNKKNYKSFKTKKRDTIIHEVGGDFDQREERDEPIGTQ